MQECSECDPTSKACATNHLTHLIMLTVEREGIHTVIYIILHVSLRKKEMEDCPTEIV